MRRAALVASAMATIAAGTSPSKSSASGPTTHSSTPATAVMTDSTSSGLTFSLPTFIRADNWAGSRYEPGLRSGMWQKMRVNQGQEFVIGGYSVSAKNFDALIFGYYRDGELIYAARTRNGFTPASREKLFRQLRGMEISQCPFSNLPEAKSGRWGQGLTAEKMKDCRWLRPELVGQFEFLEWTPDDHLRHTRFIGLREDKKPSDVTREPTT
jgi:ATP-dependent DNA ligase